MYNRTLPSEPLKFPICKRTFTHLSWWCTILSDQQCLLYKCHCTLISSPTGTKTFPAGCIWCQGVKNVWSCISTLHGRVANLFRNITFAMLTSIRVTKAGYFLDAIVYSSTIIHPESIWFKSQPWTQYGRSQYLHTYFSYGHKWGYIYICSIVAI